MINNNVKERDEPNIEHMMKSINSKSFFNLATIILKNIQFNAPSPAELKGEEVINYYPDSKSGFLNGFQVKDNEGVFCINEEIVKRQSGVFTDMAKQLAKCIFKSGTVSLSLPIRIFEPRSMLERYTDWWVFAPVLLKKAGACTSKLEAFKYAICFALSSMFFSTGQMKPFNPLLGETWEGKFQDGTNIYMEHSSHTPCVSNYLVVDSDGLYKYYGYYDISLEGTMKMLLTNYITCVQKGKHNIYLKTTGQTITYHYPKVVLGGMIYGSRYVLWDGHMKFEDRENNLKAIVCFNKSHSNLKNRRIHDIYGQIFTHDFSKEKKQKEFFESKLPKNAFPTDKSKVLSEITGSWLEHIIFDNSIYWTIADNFPPQIIPNEKISPSDSRYREDLIWLKRACLLPEYKQLYEDYSQKWKVALEVQQRHDRALREKGGKKK